MDIKSSEYSDKDNGQDYSWAELDTIENIRRIEKLTCYRYHVVAIDHEKGYLVSRTQFVHYDIGGEDYLNLTENGIECFEREERWIKCS